MKKPLRYCALPLEVRAIQWTGKNIEAVEDFIGVARFAAYDSTRGRLYVYTCAGPSRVYEGHWFVFDGARDLHVMPDIRFRAEYTETCDHHPV